MYLSEALLEDEDHLGDVRRVQIGLPRRAQGVKIQVPEGQGGVEPVKWA